jgi:hypothetical protein
MGWTPTSTHTFAALDDLGVASNLNAWVSAPIANLNTAIGATTAWTPVLTAATTNPTNYTGAGEYCQTGNFVLANFSITSGASWTAGTGQYSISLPVTAASPSLWLVYGQALWVGASTSYFLQMELNSATTARFRYQQSLTVTTAVTAAAPSAPPASTKIFGGQLLYLAA